MNNVTKGQFIYEYIKKRSIGDCSIYLKEMSDEEFDKMIDAYWDNRAEEKIKQSKGKEGLVDGPLKEQIIRICVEYERLPDWVKNNEYDED